MSELQCACIVNVMGLSHGDSFPKGPVHAHRRVVSRKALCISGDGVLSWCGGNGIRGRGLAYTDGIQYETECPHSWRKLTDSCSATQTIICRFDPCHQLKTPSIAVLRTSTVALHRALGVKDRCCIAIVGCLYIDTPEVLDSAWPSISSEAGMPKVIGPHRLRVLSPLISKRVAHDNNAKCGRSLAGVSDLKGFVCLN